MHTTREGVVKGKLSVHGAGAGLGRGRHGVAPTSLRRGPSSCGRRSNGRRWLRSRGRRGRRCSGNAVLTRAIDPPSKFVSALPASLDDIVMRALERDPARRWETAADMAQALEESGALSSSRAIGPRVKEVCREKHAARAQLVASIELATSREKRADTVPSQPAFPPPSPSRPGGSGHESAGAPAQRARHRDAPRRPRAARLAGHALLRGPRRARAVHGLAARPPDRWPRRCSARCRSR